MVKCKSWVILEDKHAHTLRFYNDLINSEYTSTSINNDVNFKN